jgi:hypothetical protein
VVLAPYTQIAVAEDADFYLVVNDRKCDEADDRHTLSLQIRRALSQTAFAAAVVTQMEATVALLRQLEPVLVGQGSILPTQLGSYRSQARLDLAARTETPLERFPSALLGLFEAFLDRELVRLERAVQIATIDRQIDALLLEFELLRQELALVSQQGRLAQLVPTWTLRNLDGEQLRHSARELASLSRKYLHPVLELWYPLALADVDVSGAAAPLRAVDPTTPTLDLVSHVDSMLDAVLASLSEAKPGYKDTAHGPLIAVSFVRSGVVAGPFTAVSSLPKGDDARSASLWTAMKAATTGTVILRAEDVYTAFGGSGGLLACVEAVPVIQRMALYVVRPGGALDSDDLNDERRFLTGRAAVTQPFAAEEGPLTYTVSNPIWESFQLPILYGSYTGALDTFVARALTSGAAELPEGPLGLSPFGTLEINFQGLRALRDGVLGDGITTPGLEATEMALVMQVDSRTSSGVSWVDACH